MLCVVSFVDVRCLLWLWLIVVDCCCWLVCCTCWLFVVCCLLFAVVVKRCLLLCVIHVVCCLLFVVC